MTIAAVSTPRAAGGIAVIRISGEDALGIAEKIFDGKRPTQMQGYTCAYGRITDGTEVIDDAVVTVFRAPHSYTGEDVCEISCHGGIYVSERILSLLYDNGASPAAAGEFTERAFLNGKMDLTSAEAVMDMISAQGRAYLRKAENVKSGHLYRRIAGYRDRLVTLLGNISAWIDYPEEDIPGISDSEIISELSDIESGLSAISRSYYNSQLIRNGIDTVIIGKPNVGKSTLMNALAGCDRSIVTSVPGTTRDIIEESIRIGDTVLRIADTAGIRDTEDIVENAGIERAIERAKRADLVIAVFDNSLPFTDEDEKICGVECEKRIACVNKSDEEGKFDESRLHGFDSVIHISAKNGDISELEKLLSGEFIETADEFLINERQKKCLDRAQACIAEARGSVGNITLDAINIVLDDALSALLELTGERVSDTVVSEVFSHFCVGK